LYRVGHTEENLECFGRNVEVVRQLEHRLAVDPRHDGAALLGEVDDVGHV